MCFILRNILSVLLSKLFAINISILPDLVCSAEANPDDNSFEYITALCTEYGELIPHPSAILNYTVRPRSTLYTIPVRYCTCKCIPVGRLRSSITEMD